MRVGIAVGRAGVFARLGFVGLIGLGCNVRDGARVERSPTSPAAAEVVTGPDAPVAAEEPTAARAPEEAVAISSPVPAPAPGAEAPAPEPERDEPPPVIKGDPRAPLGSLAFHPSPARPAGWRGDGTGRYPGAKPPVRWGRRAKTPVRRFLSQARRPKPDAKSGSPVEEYAGRFQITEWLVMGPLDPPDPGKALDWKPVPDEGAFEPDEGERAAGKVWKRVEQAGGVNFGEALGEKPKRKVAYALAFFWSDEVCRSGMGWHGNNLRQWLNGKLASGWGGATHEIRKGWNRLLVKSVSPSNNDAWGFRAFFFPRNEGLEYEEENVRWTSAMPGTSWAMPVIVGERIFLTSEPSDLVCVEKRTGRILWMRSNPVWYGAVEVERAKPPRLSYERVTSRTLTLVANRPLDRATVAAARSYSIPGAKIARAEASPDGRTVRLTAAADWPWRYGDAATVKFPGLRTAKGEAVVGDLEFTMLPGRPVGRDLLKEFLVGEIRENVNSGEVVKSPVLDEKTVRPAEGGKWKRVRSDGIYDLLRVVGDKQNVAVHACAYLYSDAAREVQLWLGSDDGVRAVVNGSAVHVLAAGRGCTPDQDRVKGVKLRKGWNTLLLMISQGGGGWGFCARVMDAEGRGPAEGVSCLAERPEDAGSGLDAAPETGAVANEPGGFGYLDGMRPKVEELARLNDELVKSMDWRKNEDRHRLARSLTEEVRRADHHYRIGLGWGGGNTAPTPVTDGRHVFAWFGDTGIMTCYDFEGRRVWTRFEKPGGGEHGINSSPVLVDDRLVVIAGGKWAAFDRRTGEVLWRQKYRHPSYGSCVVARIGDEPVLVGPDGQVLRARDGAEVSKCIGRFDGECASPVLEENRFHLFARAGYCAAELPAKADEGAGVRIVREIKPKELDPAREPYPVGSPVFHDGILFALRSGWGAGGRDVVLYPFVLDSAEPLARRVLEMAPGIYYAPEGGGVEASLAYAGGNVYVFDNRGTAIVFEAAREYREVAKNVLEHWTRRGEREVTGGTPVFEGRYMYLRQRELLYCIGGK